MAAFNTRLLTPPSEEEEIQPYRDVWRSLVLQYGVFFLITMGLFIFVNILRSQVSDTLRLPLGLVIVFIPLGLWFIFSYLPERQVPQPRHQLLSVLVISALVANAVAYPLINEFLKVDEWLSLASAVQRIIGYTFTVGVIQEILKYLVVRSVVWDNDLRVRQDALAYADAAALGFTTVLGLHFVFSGSPSPDAVAARVFSLLAIHVISAAIVSYGLAESRFADVNPLVLPLSLAFAAFVTGLAIPLRAGLVNASISPVVLEFALPRPLFGLGFSAALFAAGLYGVSFFYTTAERLDRESKIGLDT